LAAPFTTRRFIVVALAGVAGTVGVATVSQVAPLTRITESTARLPIKIVCAAVDVTVTMPFANAQVPVSASRL
jgi:type III secretory pathway component EscS